MPFYKTHKSIYAEARSFFAKPPVNGIYEIFHVAEFMSGEIVARKGICKEDDKDLLVEFESYLKELSEQESFPETCDKAVDILDFCTLGSDGETEDFRMFFGFTPKFLTLVL